MGAEAEKPGYNGTFSEPEGAILRAVETVHFCSSGFA